MEDFDKLPLHDAILKEVRVFWGTKCCSLNVMVFTNPQAFAEAYAIEFEGVSLISLPHYEPWGPSSSINTASVVAEVFRIEMQSGDTVEIKATSFSFRQL